MPSIRDTMPSSPRSPLHILTPITLPRARVCECPNFESTAMTSPTMSLVPTIELPALYDLVVRGDDDVFAFRAHSVVGAVDAHYCGFFLEGFDHLRPVSGFLDRFRFGGCLPVVTSMRLTCALFLGDRGGLRAYRLFVRWISLSNNWKTVYTYNVEDPCTHLTFTRSCSGQLSELL